MTRTGVVIFARMGSSRLPGKSLMDLCGRPVLGEMIDRMAHLSSPARIIVATSDLPGDDAISEFCRTDATCRDLKVEVFRGPHLDVLGRAAACAAHFGLDPLVRVSGDSPFMDPAVIDRVLARHAEASPDITTNRFPPTFPPGITVEALSGNCLARLDETATDPEDREHVTTFIYKNPKAFSIVNVSASRLGLRTAPLTLDTPEDLALARALKVRLAECGNPLDHLSTVDLRNKLTASTAE